MAINKSSPWNDLQEKKNPTQTVRNSPWNNAVQTGNQEVTVQKRKLPEAPVKQGVDLTSLPGAAIGTGIAQTLSGASNLVKSVPVVAEAGARAISNLAKAPVSPMTSKLNAKEVEPNDDNVVQKLANALFKQEQEKTTVELPQTEQEITKNQFQNIANREMIAQGQTPVKQITDWTNPWDKALAQNVENVQNAGRTYSRVVTPATDWLDNASQKVTDYTEREFMANLNPTEQFVAQAAGNAIPNFARNALLATVSGGSSAVLGLLSDAFMFAPSFYQGYEEGLAKGLSEEEAMLNATLRGVTEAGTEHLSDVWKVNGGQSKMDEWMLEKIAKSNLNPWAKFMGKGLASGIGESMEEVASRIGNTFADRAFYGNKIDAGQLALGSLEDAGASFISTMVMGLLGGEFSGTSRRQWNAYVDQMQNESAADVLNEAKDHKVELALTYASMSPNEAYDFVSKAQDIIRQKYGNDNEIANMDTWELVGKLDQEAVQIYDNLDDQLRQKYIDRMTNKELPLTQTTLPDGSTYNVYEYLGTRTTDQERALDMARRMGKDILFADELPMGQNALTLGDGTIIISSKAKRPATALAFHEIFHALKSDGQWNDLMDLAYNYMANEKGFSNFVEDLVSRYVSYYGNLDNNYLNSITASKELTDEQKRQEVKDYLREQGVNQYYADPNFHNMIDEEIAADFMERLNNEDSIKAMYNRSGDLFDRTWQNLKDAVQNFTGVLTKDEQNLRKTEQIFAKVAQGEAEAQERFNTEPVYSVDENRQYYNERFNDRDGRVFINDLSMLSNNDWKTIQKAVDKLGYGIGSAEAAREAFSRYVPEYGFNTEQSNAIRKAFGVDESEKKQGNIGRANLAKVAFGTTGNFNEAGYLLQDGKMLDFSGKREGGSPNQRTMDHRDISRVFDEELGNGSSATPYMNRFIDEGNIRLMPEQGVTIGEQEPTSAQYSVLKRFVEHMLDNEGFFYLDIQNENGNTIADREYGKGDKSSRIINDIKAYFKDGELPYRSQFADYRYSLDNEYLTAVEDGNVEEQDRIIEQAARNAGYNSPKVYHGTNTGDFTVFDKNMVGSNYDGWGRSGKGFYFTADESDAKIWGERGRGSKPTRVIPAYLKMDNALDLYEPAPTPVKEYIHNQFAVPENWDGTFTEDFITKSLYRTIDFLQDERHMDASDVLQSLGYDGVYSPDGVEYVVYHPSQIKSAEPVTYDDDGNIVLPSERFNYESNDIRYSLSDEQEEYFKDSKIRDEDGNLIPVYHGTMEDFTVFDRSKGRSTMDIQGMFFSPWEIDASGYGDNVGEYYLNITNPASEAQGYAALRRFQGQNNAGVKAREYLESLGYDGVNNGNEEYIAFYPEQIKRTDNLKPTKNPDVRFSLDVGDNHLYQYNSFMGDDIRPFIDGMMDMPQEGDDVNEWLTNNETQVKKNLKKLVDKSFRDIEKINLKNVKGSKAKIVNALYEAGRGGRELDIHTLRTILEQNPVTATQEMYPGESTARRRVNAASAFTEALMKNLGFDGFYDSEHDRVMARDSVGSPKAVSLEDYRDMVGRGENLEERTQRIDREDANQEYTDEDIQRQIIEDSMNLNAETPQQREDTVNALAEAMQNATVTEDIPEQANAFADRNVPQNRSAMNFLGKMSRERNGADPLTYESISPESFPVPDRIQDYIDLINDEEDRKYGFDAPIENELTDEDKDFYQGLVANRTGALQGFATPTQTFNAIAKGEQREELRDRFERPMYETKKEYNANREQRWNALENMIKETGIKANTPESAAVQWYGEGVKPNEQGETIPYTLDDLKREFPNKWQDIQKMERFMRQMYDEYVGRINAALEQVYPNLEEKAQAQLQSWRNKKMLYQDEISMSRNPSANEYWQNEINKLDAKIAKLEGDLESGEYFRNKRLNPRKDYFHHFQEVETSGLGGLKNILQASTLIDPELVGKSEFTKPKSKWMAWLQKRGEGAYTADAVLGMGKYIDSAEYAIAFDPLIAQYRDEISKMVKATRETKNANQLIQYLSAYTNQLAGKTASLDRTILDLLGEGNRGQLFNVLAAINNRAKSNAVVGNVRSAVAQIFNIPNALGIIKSNNAWLKGANDYINAKLGNRELLDQSPFLQERYFSHNVDDLKARNTNWEKIIGKAGDITNKMMEFGDREATELIWLAAYNEGLEKNVSDPVYYADDLTRRSVAGRGIGEVPYNMKSKVASFFMPFQVETNNAWQELKQNLRDKDANGIFRLMLGSYILNGFAKLLFNDGVVPDVLGALIDGIGKLFDKDREESVGEVALNTGKRIAGEAVSYIPGTSLWLPAIMSDESAEALFGDSDPTRYGTGTVGLSTITKTLADAVDGGDFDIVTPLLQMGLPYGGRQASRLYNTLQDFNVLPSNGVMNTPFGGEKNPVAGDYTQAGALKYRLPEEVNSAADVAEIARALAFGSNSTNAASEYYDTLKPVLSKERVAKLREHPEVNPDTYIDYLNEASTDGKQGITQQEAYDWISSHNLSDEEANALWEMTSSSWKKSYDEYQPKEETPTETPKEEKTENKTEKKSGNPTNKKEFTAIADSDGNGSLKQAEAYAWLNDQKLSDAEKEALWNLMGWKTDYETYASKH